MDGPPHLTLALVLCQPLSSLLGALDLARLRSTWVIAVNQDLSLLNRGETPKRAGVQPRCLSKKRLRADLTFEYHGQDANDISPELLDFGEYRKADQQDDETIRPDGHAVA